MVHVGVGEQPGQVEYFSSRHCIVLHGLLVQCVFKELPPFFPRPDTIEMSVVRVPNPPMACKAFERNTYCSINYHS